VSVTASDDGINASGGTTSDGGGMGEQDGGELITITGGDVLIDAGGDGFDSNGSAVISGGTLTVWGPTNDGNGALDVNGTLTVSGGTVLAVGSAGMAVSPDASSPQSWIAASASGSPGSVVQITDDAGTVVAEFAATKQFASVVYSGAGLVGGGTYTVSVDGTATSVTEGTAAEGGMGSMGGGGGSPGPRP
jgi:hypothetical protein